MRRPEILQRLGHCNSQQVIVLRSRRGMAAFLRELGQYTTSA